MPDEPRKPPPDRSHGESYPGPAEPGDAAGEPYDTAGAPDAEAPGGGGPEHPEKPRPEDGR